MKKLFIAALLALVSTGASAQPVSDTIPARGGPIRITAKFHASTQLEYLGNTIVVDPVSFASWTKKADVILVTHTHGDHLDLPAIAKLLKPDTQIVAPADAAATIDTIRGVRSGRLGHADPLRVRLPRSNGSNFDIWIRGVPMYNLVRGPRPGQEYHPIEKRWNGYIVSINGTRLYLAGDTEATPEMRALRDIDAAFLPMNLPYTMTPQEAASAAREFRPRVVYPYHYRYPFNKDSGNERTFQRLMRGSGVRVKLLQWYPAAAVARASKSS